MTEKQLPEHRRLVWPWFAAAAVLLAILLAVVWMNAAVNQIRRGQQFDQRSPGPNPPRNPSTNTALSLDAESASLLTGGDAEAGRKVFFEKPEASCAKCHRIGDLGGDLGPPLDGIGARESRQALLDSMLKPNARITEGYGSIILVLTNGTGLSGLLRSETETQLVLLTPEAGLVTLEKSSIRSRQRGVSLMPEGLDQWLLPTDLRNLVEYLSQLR